MFIGPTYTSSRSIVVPLLGLNNTESEKGQTYQELMDDKKSKFEEKISNITDINDKENFAKKKMITSGHFVKAGLTILGAGAAGFTFLACNMNPEIAMVAFPTSFVLSLVGTATMIESLENKTTAQNFLKEHFPDNEVLKSVSIKDRIISVRDKIFGEPDTSSKLKI